MRFRARGPSPSKATGGSSPSIATRRREPLEVVVESDGVLDERPHPFGVLPVVDDALASLLDAQRLIERRPEFIGIGNLVRFLLGLDALAHRA
ncbi:hypothetical protein BRD07_08310 [Halobacteriales archaeon QS_9_68_42]|nr:MAG: hypothetical protein BRD07_08310 [Halobacteriales archaeon QS_9_68_42]